MELLKIGDQEVQVFEIYESEKARLYRREDTKEKTWIPISALHPMKFDITNLTSIRTVKDWFTPKISWK